MCSDSTLNPTSTSIIWTRRRCRRTPATSSGRTSTTAPSTTCSSRSSKADRGGPGGDRPRGRAAWPPPSRGPGMDFLTVITPEGASTRRDLDGETLRIGRASGNDLVLQDLNVSRNHASVVRRTEGVYIVDAGGKNGTYVNDQRITDPVRLGAGDRVRLGSKIGRAHV